MAGQMAMHVLVISLEGETACTKGQLIPMALLEMGLQPSKPSTEPGNRRTHCSKGSSVKSTKSTCCAN
jgi:hypothetical protein